MSRCFPFPQRWCVRNGIRDEALIESIKREAEKAKKERKKEKRREKKERKAKENGDADNKTHRHKRRHKGDGNLANEKDGDCHKKRKLDSERVERSSLTEEHGKPINSQNSSDSISNSDQRQKPDFVPEAGQNSASVIRIRLPLQRQRDPEVVPIGDRSCSAPVRLDHFACEKNENALRSSSVSGEHLSSSSVRTGQELAVKHGRAELRPLTGVNETSTSGNELSTVPKLKQHRPLSSELHYIDLIENWTPPLYQSLSVDLDDQNWLFEGKQKPRQDTYRCKVEQGSLVNTSSTAWPLSQLLPDLGIYALPYAVPY
ncbi:hypothetical protein MLD38_029570 [Melastoma candidum]|uniref:Uncharacterized protein n=1 Tax=Melastoma candidum TaxID=119954 RepID=A0ACB9N4D0_9MYRT|nr:hypothetical protein MLD38_029570 [Melastoma candidum]